MTADHASPGKLKRRCLMLTASVTVTIGSGLFLPSGPAYRLFHHTGYYFTLAAVAIWLFFMLRRLQGRWRPYLRRHYPALLLAVGVTVMIFSVSTPQFRVLSDEANLMGVSLAMVEDKAASLPIQDFQIDYEPFRPAYSPNKRPLLFPFLTSVMHGILGYHPNHGIHLNFLCTIGLLMLVYIFVNAVYTPFYGILAMLVLAGMPIFWIWTTASGFEALNLFFLLFFLYGIYRANRDADMAWAEMAVWTSLMLVQCRYESIIFIFFCLLIHRIISRDVLQRFSGITFWAPLFCLPVLWQRKYFINITEPVRQGLEFVETTTQGFSLNHLMPNLGIDIFVLTGIDPDLGFNPVVTLAAVLGMALVLKSMITEPARRSRAAIYSLLAVVGAFAGLLVIYAAYQWGDFTLPISNRLALVFAPFMVLAAVPCLYLVGGDHVERKRMLLVACLVQLVLLTPYAYKQQITQNLSLSHEYKSVVASIQQRYDTHHQEILIISDRPNLYLIHHWGSLNFTYANQHKSYLQDMQQRYFDKVIVLQRIQLDTQTPSAKNRLDSSFKTRKVTTVKGSYQTRIDLLEVEKIVL